MEAKGRAVCSVTDSSQGSGTTGSSSMPRQSSHAAAALGAELGRDGVGVHGGDFSHGVEAEAVHAQAVVGGEGEKVDGVRSEEGRRVEGDLRRAAGGAAQGGHEGGELGVGDAHAGTQVGGQGVHQCADQTGLATVHLLQPVQPDVGGTEAGVLDAVADALQGGDRLLEGLAVGRLVGVDGEGVGVEGKGLLQRHAGGDARHGGEVVGDGGPALRAVDDDHGLLREVGLPPHLDLCPEMGDDDTGDSHGPSDKSNLVKKWVSGWYRTCVLLSSVEEWEWEIFGCLPGTRDIAPRARCNAIPFRRLPVLSYRAQSVG